MLLITLVACCPWMRANAAEAEVGTPFDLQGYVDQAIAEGQSRIVIPPGRYRVTPRNHQHLVLHQLQDVEVIADGVEMICTETTRAVTVSHCKNVTLRGLVIDYDPLPYTQGRITAISADRQTYDIELFEGYPPAETVRNFKYEIFRADTRTLRCEDHYVSEIEVIDARHLRLTCPGNHDRNPEQVGDLIVIGSENAPHGSIPHAVECNGNVNVRLEQIALYASNCFGFLEYNCDGSVYSECRIDRRSPNDDLKQRESPRLRSLDADAFHSKHAIRGPSYLNCSARFMGDDCINICGDYHMIMNSSGETLRVLAKGEMNIEPGDPVELVLFDGVRLPDAKAIAVVAAGSIRDEEQQYLAQQNLHPRLQSGEGLEKAYTITLDSQVDIDRGGVVCPANRIGNGFAVKNCHFGFNRSRGILIKASNGEISGNRMEGCWMSAILVSPEYWWLEAGSSNNLVIRDNTITDCQGIAVRIEAPAGNGSLAPAGAHRDIRVTNNHIAKCTMPGILVTSTADLQLEGNTFEDWQETQDLPHQLREAGITQLKPIVKIQCEP
ncbi:right-handed parallel beta-helix repeat-containing protein [Aeoliella mucimassa]|uniref:right-handed parallel beta-helix repeat-containing protein n=1 Tax=Aeoliella mucimassa TaxID=2527972 RepID=UPI0018D3D12B|nr:right-handed parallel beta-helix repeat-containing protein [Aeoliella mucimassa]